MGKYPPALLKGMARRVLNAANTSEAPFVFTLMLTVSQRTGLDIDVVRNRIIELADFENQNSAFTFRV